MRVNFFILGLLNLTGNFLSLDKDRKVIWKHADVERSIAFADKNIKSVTIYQSLSARLR